MDTGLAKPAVNATGTPESAWRRRKDAWEHLGYILSELVRVVGNGSGEPETLVQEAGKLIG
ncbi:hypothetical protein [Arthrobacter sp. JCM 19049]|nr:hypothetical protein [Arthrobacter sp. JCM 19049]